MRQVSMAGVHDVYLGNARDARDLKALAEKGIQAVVDLAADEPPATLFRDVAYLRIPLIDGAGNPACLLKLAIVTVELLLHEKVCALVACSHGMSRSPAVFAMAISRSSGRPPADCLPEGPLDLSEGLWNELDAVWQSDA